MTIELWFEYKTDDSRLLVKDAINRFYASFVEESEYVALIDEQDFISFFLFLAQHSEGVLLHKKADSLYDSDVAHSDRFLEVTI